MNPNPHNSLHVTLEQDDNWVFNSWKNNNMQKKDSTLKGGSVVMMCAQATKVVQMPNSLTQARNFCQKSLTNF